MRPRFLRFAALSLLVSTGACFHYVPALEAPAQGTPVRVPLSRPVAVQLRELTANNVIYVRGEVISAESRRLLLSVFALRAQSGFEYRAAGETVALPSDAVAGLEERRFSVRHTVLAAAVLTAAGYIFQRTLSGAIGGGESGDGTDVSR